MLSFIQVRTAHLPNPSFAYLSDVLWDAMSPELNICSYEDYGDRDDCQVVIVAVSISQLDSHFVPDGLLTATTGPYPSY